MSVESAVMSSKSLDVVVAIVSQSHVQMVSGGSRHSDKGGPYYVADPDIWLGEPI